MTGFDIERTKALEAVKSQWRERVKPLRETGDHILSELEISAYIGGGFDAINVAVPALVAEAEALRVAIASREPSAPEPYLDSFGGCTDRNPDICACGQDTGAQCCICEQDIEDGQMIQTLTSAVHPYLPEHHRDQEWEHYIWHVTCATKAADESDQALETS